MSPKALCRHAGAWFGTRRAFSELRGGSSSLPTLPRSVKLVPHATTNGKVLCLQELLGAGVGTHVSHSNDSCGRPTRSTRTQKRAHWACSGACRWSGHPAPPITCC